MRLFKAILKEGTPTPFESDIEFKNNIFEPGHINGIKTCHVKIIATQYENLLKVDFDISAVIMAVCSYTLEEFDYKIDVKDSLNFSDEIEDEEIYLENKNYIDLDEYILSIILANVPIKLVKPGNKLPEGKDGYRVISEDDLAKESKNKPSPFDCLDDLDL